MNLVPYFIITDGQTRNKYHIRLDMHTQPYQPHYIPPNWGGARCRRGPKIQSHHHLAPQRRLRSPKLKYEALEISEVRGPLEKKSAYALQLFWAPLNARYYTLQLLLGATLKAK